MALEKQVIYDALDPAWWVQQTNGWQTTFLSTQILFDTEGTKDCVYVSSAPIQTGGLNSSPVDAPNTQLDTTTDLLRHEAAQRLYDMHTTAITGHENLTAVYSATS